MAHRLVAHKGNPTALFLDNEVGWWHGALFNYYLKHLAASHMGRNCLPWRPPTAIGSASCGILEAARRGVLWAP
jgi:hypothetical protein